MNYKITKILTKITQLNINYELEVDDTYIIWHNNNIISITGAVRYSYYKKYMFINSNFFSGFDLLDDKERRRLVKAISDKYNIQINKFVIF